jgi:glycosyltransferase involved in cell wall biosynthesis
MVGPYPNNILAYARDLGLDEAQVYFTGSVSYNEVAGYIKNSNALVLFSRYENLPCVILESLCCGVPVISTRVGGVAEVINTENGVLVDNENEDQLTAAFNEMYVGYATYNAEAISAAATKLFSYEAVGQAIHSVYVNVAGA